ncbi:hypothetical protein IIF7_11178 [Zunongwangia atlantica 22II14-10F7]|uniref:DUF4468 domain-containing protein n=2 Tax=Zunongwangia TaxID=417127 RepID=A0A1Y1T2X8_9FLAO|nr:hypothetical protein IIF7_11178 [Zunongwangia atlantica 22II14-10F7]
MITSTEINKEMKKLITIITLILTSITANAQEYTNQTKSITGIFQAEGKNKDEIFENINKWIALNYNSAQDVIQMNDKDGGNIIVKGINSITYKNNIKELYPNNKFIAETITNKFNHTIEVNIKENKYRIIYTLSDIIPPAEATQYSMEGQFDLIFDMIDFTGVKEDKIEVYNAYLDNLLKKGLMGKKKRQKMKDLSKPIFTDLTNSLEDNIKATMLSIKESVSTTSTSDW